MKNALLRALGPAIGIFLFGAALWVLENTLAEYRYRDIVASLQGIAGRQLAFALILTLFSYLILTGYELLAMRYIRCSLPWRKIGFAAAISYAFSNAIGLSILTSGSVRYRLYSSWGLSPVDIARVVMFCAVTLWLGILSSGGSILLIESLALPASLHLPFASGQILGLLMLSVAVAYLLFSALHPQPLRIRGWQLEVPSPALAVQQLLIGALDWILAGAILYVLLPHTSVSFAHFLGVFLVAQTVGLISHVPGGLGVFESLVLLMLPTEMTAVDLLAALLAYRLIYYLLPLATATVGLGIYESLRHRWTALWLPKMVGPWISVLLPQILALMALLSGAILLFSAATPAVGSRMDRLQDFIPLSVMEFSHFLGSLIGTGLLLLARGLQRRLDAAYVLVVGLLVAGIVASLLKGGDYEEAIVLTVLLAGLLPCRRYFYRKASLFGQRFTTGWLAAIMLVLICSIWLGLFSYRHVEYSNELWWEFSFTGEGNAPRFLRAMVGALALLLFFAIAKLLRQAPYNALSPDPEALGRARTIIADYPLTYAHLALLEDKSLLFNSSYTAFIMYGVEGRTWVAMSDPVGPAEERRELAWRFREMSEYHGGWTVFYQVRMENLDLYLDLGLTLLKIGEEARVLLAEFSLEGKERKNLRNTLNRIEKAGCRFEIVQPEAVPSLLPQLKRISDAWLADKNTREKGFSLGYFQEDYLATCPMALVHHEGNLIAFANLLVGTQKEELSIDLMRYLPNAPNGIMDYLFLRLMLWGKEQGYTWFNLGMAPLAGLENRSLAPLWTRFGALVFGRSERFYNFQGLHQYKNKFAPRWEPRYLALPGGITLPRILANLSALIAGSLKGVIKK